MYDINWDGQSEVYDDGNELSISAHSCKRSENIFGIMFMGVWVAFVLLFVSVGVSGLVEWVLAPSGADTKEFFFQNPFACGTCFFFLIPFVMLMFGGNHLGWLLFGKEKLLVQPDRITHRIGWWIFKRVKIYEADRIREVFVKEDAVVSGWHGMQFGQSSGNAHIIVSYGNVGVRFFRTIGDSVELEALAERIRSRIGLEFSQGVADVVE